MRTEAMRIGVVLSGLLLAVACSEDEGAEPVEPVEDAGRMDAEQFEDVSPDVEMVDVEEEVTPDPPPATRVVTADWLSHTLSVFDYGSLTEGADAQAALLDTIDLSAFEQGPLQLEVAPGGRVAMVSLSPGFFDGPTGALVGSPEVPAGGALLIVDLEEGIVTSTIETGHIPMGLAISPDGATGYSANFGQAGARGRTLSVIDLASGALVEDVEVGSGPEQVSLDGSGALGIVNLAGGGGVRVFRTDDVAGSLSPVVETGNDPSDLAFLGDGLTAVVVNSQSLDAVLIDVNDPSQPTVLARVALRGGFPYGADLIPGTRSLLVTATGASASLIKLEADTDTLEITETIELPGGGFPLNAAVDGAGHFAFVPHAAGRTLSIVDLTLGEARAIQWLEGDSGPTYVVVY